MGLNVIKFLISLYSDIFVYILSLNNANNYVLVVIKSVILSLSFLPD